MSQQETIAKVNELMTRGFEIPAEKLKPAATLFDELGLDSLDAVDMLVHLEENLGIKIDAERLTQVRTMQDIYDLAEGLVLQPQAQSQLSH